MTTILILSDDVLDRICRRFILQSIHRWPIQFVKSIRSVCRKMNDSTRRCIREMLPFKEGVVSVRELEAVHRSVSDLLMYLDTRPCECHACVVFFSAIRATPQPPLNDIVAFLIVHCIMNDNSIWSSVKSEELVLRIQTFLWYTFVTFVNVSDKDPRSLVLWQEIGRRIWSNLLAWKDDLSRAYTDESFSQPIGEHELELHLRVDALLKQLTGAISMHNQAVQAETKIV